MNSRKKKGLIAAAVVAALGAGGAAIAVGTDEAGDDDATQRSITGSELKKASAAAPLLANERSCRVPGQCR